MEDEPKDGADERPKLFKNMTAWIGGVTAVVVALGGLTGAFRQLVKDGPRQAASSADGRTSDAAQPAQQNAATPTEEDDPWYYTTDDGGTLRWVDGMWVETTADGTRTRYDNWSSGDGMTVAMKPGGAPDGTDLYLRWPTAGGRAQKSVDRQENWTDAYKVTVDEEAPST